MKQVFQVNIFYIPSGYLTWPWYRWPIEIDGLPIRNGGSFHGYVSHNQRVCIYIYIIYITTLPTIKMYGMQKETLNS